MKIVLSLIVRNSAERLGKIFEKVLESSLIVPYDSIIVIDDSTSENTKNIIINFASNHDKELIISKSNTYGYHKPTRATARQTAIDIFLNNFSGNYTWIFFLDDDVTLNRNFWNAAQLFINNDNVGIITGIAILIDPILYKYAKLRKTTPLRSFIISVINRGFTGDTLFKRKALKDVRVKYGIIPPYLHEYEDAWLFYKIKCLHYKYIIIPTLSYHFNIQY